MGPAQLRQGRARPGHARLARRGARRASATCRWASRERRRARARRARARAAAAGDGAGDRDPRALADAALRALARRPRPPRSTTPTVAIAVRPRRPRRPARPPTRSTTTRCARARRARDAAAAAAARAAGAARRLPGLPAPRGAAARTTASTPTPRGSTPRAGGAALARRLRGRPPSDGARGASGSGRSARVETAIASSAGVRAHRPRHRRVHEGDLPRAPDGRSGLRRRAGTAVAADLDAGALAEPRGGQGARRGEPAELAAGRVPGGASSADAVGCAAATCSAAWRSTASPTPRAAARSPGRLGRAGRRPGDQPRRLAALRRARCRAPSTPRACPRRRCR